MLLLMVGGASRRILIFHFEFFEKTFFAPPKILAPPLLPKKKTIKVSGFFEKTYKAKYHQTRHCEIVRQDDNRYEDDGNGE